MPARRDKQVFCREGSEGCRLDGHGRADGRSAWFRHLAFNSFEVGGFALISL